MANKTVTDARMKQALYSHFKFFLDNENIPEQITKSIEEHNIKSGRVIEFYQFLDKALVRLSDGVEVEAWILHRCMGSIIDMYTPEGEQIISEKKNEPCIIPKYELKALVAELDKNEFVLLGYYNPNMVGAFSPPLSGAYAVKTLTDTSQGGLTVNPQEIKLTSNNGPSFVERDLGESTTIKYANSDNTYTKDEVYKKSQTYSKTQTYNKTEVDALLKEIWDYIKPEEEEENTDG